MNDPTLFWTAAAAIGQIIGAAFTAAAVAVSLWIVLSERRERMQFVVGRRVIFGASLLTLDIVSFSVVNVGVRPIEVTSFGWRTGWSKRGPDWLRDRYAIQMFGSGLGAELPSSWDRSGLSLAGSSINFVLSTFGCLRTSSGNGRHICA